MLLAIVSAVSVTALNAEIPPPTLAAWLPVIVLSTIVTGPSSAETPPPAFPTLFPEIVSSVKVALPPNPFVASAPPSPLKFLLPVSVSSVRLTWARPTLTMLAVAFVEPMRVTSLIATVGGAAAAASGKTVAGARVPATGAITNSDPAEPALIVVELAPCPMIVRLSLSGVWSAPPNCEFNVGLIPGLMMIVSPLAALWMA